MNGAGGAGHLTALGLAGGEFAVANLAVPVTDPGAWIVGGLQVTASNGVGAFEGAGGATFGGSMPLHGVMKVCLFGPCSNALQNLSIPLSSSGIGTRPS